MERVLVTGAAGYIGSVVCRQLLARGYEVVGLDKLLFGGEALLNLMPHPRFRFVFGDLREEAAVKDAFTGVTAAVHLAAIVGDPACAKQPDLAQSTNWQGALKIAEAAEACPTLTRFVFISTCSNYGRAGEGFVTETSALTPVSLYARLKVDFEKHLLSSELNAKKTCTVLRFATAFGLSPRMRFDLTVNDFTREAVLKKHLKIFGKQFWRPYCHVEDLARACVTVLEAEAEKVKGEVFGVGSTEENYQKEMILAEVMKLCPDTKVDFVEVIEDPRDYRVDFKKIRDRLGFKTTRTVPQGIAEMKLALDRGFFPQPFDPRYANLP